MRNRVRRSSKLSWSHFSCCFVVFQLNPQRWTPSRDLNGRGPPSPRKRWTLTDRHGGPAVIRSHNPSLAMSKRNEYKLSSKKLVPFSISMQTTANPLPAISIHVRVCSPLNTWSTLVVASISRLRWRRLNGTLVMSSSFLSTPGIFAASRGGTWGNNLATSSAVFANSSPHSWAPCWVFPSMWIFIMPAVCLLRLSISFISSTPTASSTTGQPSSSHTGSFFPSVRVIVILSCSQLIRMPMRTSSRMGIILWVSLSLVMSTWDFGTILSEVDPEAKATVHSLDAAHSPWSCIGRKQWVAPPSNSVVLGLLPSKRLTRIALTCGVPIRIDRRRDVISVTKACVDPVSPGTCPPWSLPESPFVSPPCLSAGGVVVVFKPFPLSSSFVQSCSPPPLLLSEADDPFDPFFPLPSPGPRRSIWPFVFPWPFGFCPISEFIDLWGQSFFLCCTLEQIQQRSRWSSNWGWK